MRSSEWKINLDQQEVHRRSGKKEEAVKLLVLRWYAVYDEDKRFPIAIKDYKGVNHVTKPLSLFQC